MKQRAKDTLAAAGIEIGQSFDALTSDQLAAIRSEAAAAFQHKHERPMPASADTYIRKRYDLLQQRARS